jgi:hypothetical protein
VYKFEDKDLKAANLPLAVEVEYTGLIGPPGVVDLAFNAIDSK